MNTSKLESNSYTKKVDDKINLSDDYIFNKCTKRSKKNYKNVKPIDTSEFYNENCLKSENDIKSISCKYENENNDGYHNKFFHLVNCHNKKGKKSKKMFNKIINVNNNRSGVKTANYSACRVPLASAVYLYISRRFYKKEIHANIVTRYHTSKLINQIFGIKVIDDYISFINKKKAKFSFTIDKEIVSVIEVAIKNLLSKTSLNCMLDIDGYENNDDDYDNNNMNNNNNNNNNNSNSNKNNKNNNNNNKNDNNNSNNNNNNNNNNNLNSSLTQTLNHHI